MPKFNPMKHRVPVLKRFYPSVRKRLARAFWPGGYAVVTAAGALFLVNWRNFVDRQIAFYGAYESDQVALLLSAMRDRGCDLFLDIGANIGFYTVLIGRSGLAGRLIAFEPDPRSLDQLGANLLMNGLTGKVEIVAKAVSDRAGRVPFAFHDATATGLSRIAEHAADTVDAIRVDDAVNAQGLTIFAKIDVEGHERAVLRGMRATLDRNRVFLQVEAFAGAAFDALRDDFAALSVRHVASIGDDHFFSNF